MDGRVENLAELLHAEHGLALVVAELGDGKVGRWIGAPFRRSGVACRLDRHPGAESIDSAPKAIRSRGRVGGVPPDQPCTGCTSTKIGYGSGHSVAEAMLRLHRLSASDPSTYSTEPPF